jgi:hypothetical protein
MQDDEESPRMTRLLRPKLGSLLLAVAVASSACRTGSRANDEHQAKSSISVENREFIDMGIYALRSGQRFRLGIATGHSTTVFTIPEYLVKPGEELQFVCDPIGAVRDQFSERMTVYPGDYLVLIIYNGECTVHATFMHA